MKFFVLTISFFCVCNIAFGEDAYGCLEIVNVTEPWSVPCRFWAYHYDSNYCSTGFDDIDIRVKGEDLARELWWPYDLATVYSSLTTCYLWSDYRPIFPVSYYYPPSPFPPGYGDIPLDIYRIYLGYIHYNLNSPPLDNWLLFNFYTTNPPPSEPSFGDNYVTFFSRRLAFGNNINVKLFLDYCYSNSIEPKVPMIQILSSDFNKHYDTGARLIITGIDWPVRSIVCDLNGDKTIDYKDFAMLSNSWLQPMGKYDGDLDGPNGFPDGLVDVYDLIYFSDLWLDCQVDFNKDGQLDFKDYTVMASNWDKNGLGDISGDDGWPDGKVDGWDLKILFNQWSQ